MDRPSQCLASMQRFRQTTAPPSAWSQAPRAKCLTRAHRGRGFSRGMSAWAWPGPLSWRDGNPKPPPSSRSPAPPSSTKAPPEQPVTAGQRDATSRSGKATELADETHVRGNGTSSSSGPGGRGSLPRAAVPPGLSTMQPQAPPPLQQPQRPKADTIATFAYGANMNFLTLARREVRVLSRDPAFVVDPAVRLVFKHQGGYATLERPGEDGGVQTGSKEEPRFRPYDGRVHGVLYRATREDFEKLAKREGGYVVQELQVETYDGCRHTALVFVSNPLFKLPQEVTPTEKYLARLREGAADNYLDPAYQAFLSGICTVPGAGLGSEYYNTPSKYMGYSFLVVVALITLAFFFQH